MKQPTAMMKMPRSISQKMKYMTEAEVQAEARVEVQAEARVEVGAGARVEAEAGVKVIAEVRVHRRTLLLLTVPPRVFMAARVKQMMTMTEMRSLVAIATEAGQ